ncbi:peptide chain release factor N(5)-glutamine methyltransferase [Sphingomonas parva]|uniref:Release factor glutamine methyltransferase n=1 Tax=Sphingomonas parva TaxID=2555898 RepID=A0A4Y8ZQD8_9SPHN|nr:peptide chain release factor N(5)-glutamine methyltransferase [Sphingomonas parva]TFI58223.1 peptide chain release factor N(5)-glutamine methyltransferase [Sphingomonas parva]
MTPELSIREALAAAARRLTSASATPRLDAELLMAHALGIDRDRLLLGCPDAAEPPAFAPLVARREAGEPIAYIVGRRAFWTIELEVGPGVLIPRPDSETLIEAALLHFGKRAPETILDLGTGPGTLLLAALDQWPGARGLGVDASEEALAYARRNAERLGLAACADFRLGDWADGLAGPYDLILCNPPYIEADAELPRDVREWEPHGALFAGRDGLDDYRRLATMIAPLLRPGGVACIELGAGQAGAVAPLFTARGLNAATRADLAGHRRCLVLTL